MVKIGSTEAIRDWFNASFYNKEEIDNLFIQNNQQSLIPYNLMITGDQPEQMIKLVGQTSGKTYNICLAALIGEDMIDYKTTEQNTGIKWIDGKDIYQITINLPSLTNGQISEFTTLIDKLIYIEGIFDYINSSTQDQCRYIPCEGEISRMFWVNNSTHRLEYYGAYNDRIRANSVYITIRYTKV